jgi:dihydroflavonol-4-reductase
VVLVTGVSGFVGSAVARVLAANGRRVRGLARASSPRENLADFPGELVTGDLRDEGAVHAAMQGVRHLFHVAADYRCGRPIPRRSCATTATPPRHRDGGCARRRREADRLYEQRRDARPRSRRAGRRERAAREDEVVGAYKRSKVVAERLVETMVAAGLPAVIVNPSTPIGPRDVRPTPTGRIVVEAANGRMPAFLDSGLNLVHVDDVAQGHVLALEKAGSANAIFWAAPM